MRSKFFYHVSFWYGVVSLLVKILAIPAMIVIFQAQGIESAMFAQLPISEIVYLLASPVGDMLVGILIVTISLSLIRGTTKPNTITKIAAIMISIAALGIVILIIFGIFSLVSTQSVPTLVSMGNQLSKATYPSFPLFFLASIILLTVGYVKEKLNASPRKYPVIVFPSAAILIVILVDLLRIFH